MLNSPDAWFHSLKLTYDELLSTFAFKFNVRRCSPVAARVCATAGRPDGVAAPKVGQCRLTVSEPVLKAPMVSALDTRI